MGRLAGGLLWAGAGALAALTVLGIASIGLLLLPLTALAVGLLLHHHVPGVVGLVAGAGLLVLGAGLAEALDGIPACTDEPLVARPGEAAARCESGGIPGWLLAGVGAAMVAGGLVGAVRSDD